MSDDDTKPILLVKKADAKKASLWNKLTNGRIIKQHGGFDIPEGDLHAIPKYSSPIDDRKASEEETKDTLSDLEKEIQKLKVKENDKQPSLPQQSANETNQLFSNEAHNYKKEDNSFE